MPTIPLINGSVSARSQGQVGIRADATSFGAGVGQAVQGLGAAQSQGAGIIGQGIRALGNAVDGIEKLLIAREERDQTLDAQRKEAQARVGLEKQLIEAKEAAPRNGEGYTDAAIEIFDKHEETLLSGAKSKFQERIFQETLAKRRASVELEGIQFEVQKRKSARVEDVGDLIEANTLRIMNGADIKEATDETISAISAAGLDAATTKTLTDKAKRELANSAVSVIGLRDPDAGLALLQNEEVQKALGVEGIVKHTRILKKDSEEKNERSLIEFYGPHLPTMPDDKMREIVADHEGRADTPSKRRAVATLKREVSRVTNARAYDPAESVRDDPQVIAVRQKVLAGEATLEDATRVSMEVQLAAGVAYPLPLSGRRAADYANIMKKSFPGDIDDNMQKLSNALLEQYGSYADEAFRQIVTSTGVTTHQRELAQEFLIQITTRQDEARAVPPPTRKPSLDEVQRTKIDKSADEAMNLKGPEMALLLADEEDTLPPFSKGVPLPTEALQLLAEPTASNRAWYDETFGPHSSAATLDASPRLVSLGVLLNKTDEELRDGLLDPNSEENKALDDIEGLLAKFSEQSSASAKAKVRDVSP